LLSFFLIDNFRPTTTTTRLRPSLGQYLISLYSRPLPPTSLLLNCKLTSHHRRNVPLLPPFAALLDPLLFVTPMCCSQTHIELKDALRTRRDTRLVGWCLPNDQARDDGSRRRSLSRAHRDQYKMGQIASYWFYYWPVREIGRGKDQ
jgi:hypothetical protein